MTSAGKTTANMLRFPGRVRKPVTSSHTPDPGSVASLSSRDRILILGCVAAVTALAWGYLFYLDHQMSSARQYDKMTIEMGMLMAMPWTARVAGATMIVVGVLLFAGIR